MNAPLPLNPLEGFLTTDEFADAIGVSKKTALEGLDPSGKPYTDHAIRVGKGGGTFLFAPDYAEYCAEHRHVSAIEIKSRQLARLCGLDYTNLSKTLPEIAPTVKHRKVANRKLYTHEDVLAVIAARGLVTLDGLAFILKRTPAEVVYLVVHASLPKPDMLDARDAWTWSDYAGLKPVIRELTTNPDNLISPVNKEDLENIAKAKTTPAKVPGYKEINAKLRRARDAAAKERQKTMMQRSQKRTKRAAMLAIQQAVDAADQKQLLEEAKALAEKKRLQGLPEAQRTPAQEARLAELRKDDIAAEQAQTEDRVRRVAGLDATIAKLKEDIEYTRGSGSLQYKEPGLLESLEVRLQGLTERRAKL